MKYLKFLLIMLLACSLCACDPTDDLIAHEQEVYNALLDHWDINSESPILIRANSIEFNHRDQIERTERFKYKEIDLESTKASFYSINTTSSPLPLPDSEQVIVFPELEYKQIFENREQSLTTRWKQFHKKYPQPNGFISLSRTGFNSAANKALVYYQSSCGSLCGNGFMAYLERGPFGWKLVWLEHLWVS